MFIHPLLLNELALAIQRDRVADAEHHRRLQSFIHSPAARRRSSRPRLVASRMRTADDLGSWLVRAGDAASRYAPSELDGVERQGLETLVAELLDAAREGGVAVSVTVDSTDSSIVLLRTLGTLAAMSAGRSIPVKRRRRQVLEAALDQLTGTPQQRSTQNATVNRAA